MRDLLWLARGRGFIQMNNLEPPMRMPLQRLAVFFIIALLISASAGCSRIVKRKVTVPPVLSPLVEAETPKLLDEVNRLASVRSLSGKVDIQFLDTSFAECGIAEKYRTADGKLVIQRPGQIYLSIQVPVLNRKIADMSSDGERFWIALYEGDEKYKRFVGGTNSAVYPKLDGEAAKPRCDGDGKKQVAAMQRATVNTLSSLRPHHFTDSLMVLPAADNSNFIYTQSEHFQEETDTRATAKPGARVVRGYYILSELEPQGANRARVLRHLWFDRVGGIRLARIQSYDERGSLTTDVLYGESKSFGEGGERLPGTIDLTRPHDSYSIRITFQEPPSVKVNQPFDRDIFILKNTSNLPEVNLDAPKK